MTSLVPTLSPDFHRRSQAKLSALLSSSPFSAPLVPPSSAPASPAAAVVAPEPSSAASDAQVVVSIEDKVVRLEPRGRRSALLKDPPPGGLAALPSLDDLELYSLEALKKLAKLEHVEVAKNCNRDAVVQALRARVATGNVDEGRGAPACA